MAGAPRHIRHTACALVVAGLFSAGSFCVAPAQGQAVRDEGFPAKPASSEESAAGTGEACVAVLFPGEFEERCAEANEANAPDPFGGQGGASPLEGGDPFWNGSPRLECPSAVFLEELETASIECRAWGASGEAVSEDAIDFEWERIGGETRDYMEHPRLTPQDVPNPVVVAPSSPLYDTLESFLAEETTKKYRYRLRATSRATGLSSFAEVDVFVLLNRPSVYCPLEVEVEEGGTVVLACEGADPLSFRMDSGDEDGRAPVLWEWEGLWGASTSGLSATDLPAPLFTAPLGAAGETYHYVASMTTTSSGVPRTARRKVSVTVTAGQGGAAPRIDCPDARYTVYEGGQNFPLQCTATDVPVGATYQWTGPRTAALVHLTDKDSLVATFIVPPDINANEGGGFQYDYTVTMRDAANLKVTSDHVTVVVWERPNITYCLVGNSKSFDEGDVGRGLTGCTTHPQGDRRFIPNDPQYRYEWKIKPGTPTPSNALSLLSATNVKAPVFTPPLNVNQNTVYEYDMVISSDSADALTVDWDVTVRDTDGGEFNLACDKDAEFNVWAGTPNIVMTCLAPKAPFGATWAWTARAPTTDTSLLTATNIRNPEFRVPRSVPTTTKYYYTVSVSDGSKTQEKDVVVEVRPPLIVISFSDTVQFFEGDPDRQIGNVTLTARNSRLSTDYYAVRWTGYATSDKQSYPTGSALVAATLSDSLSPNPLFRVPQDVTGHQTHIYRVFISWRFRTNGPYVRQIYKDIWVEVLDRDLFTATIAVTCQNRTVYEGEGEITLSCTASSEPAGRITSYAWDSPRDGPLAKARLTKGTDGPTPTFAVPHTVNQKETYEYRLVVRGDDKTIPAAKRVTVTVLKKPDIVVTCPGNPYKPYEGEGTIPLDCSATGAPSGSTYTYSWKERNNTPDTKKIVPNADGDLLAFAVPDMVTANETYEYTLTAEANGAEGTAEVTVYVLKKGNVAVTCPGNPYTPYEGSETLNIECSAPGAPPDASYAWAPRDNATPAHLLSPKNSPKTTFAVPASVEEDKKYEYALTVSAPSIHDATENVTVNVLNRPDITVTCTDPDSVHEGGDDIPLDCKATGALPAYASTYAYSWKAHAPTADVSLLTAKDVLSPIFKTPKEVDETTMYEYTLTVTAENANPGGTDVTVTVLNTGEIAVLCPGHPYSKYEGSEDITLECRAAGAPDGAAYEYSWKERGGTQDVSLLSDPAISSPRFDVLASVEQDETYEYTLTATSGDLEPGETDVTVTVRKKGEIAVACQEPPQVYEGADDVTLSCSAPGAPADATYAWEAQGAPADVSLLSARNILSPMFDVPDEVSRNETYKYALTVSAESIHEAMASVTITVRDKREITATCTDPPPVLEGTGNITLQCSAPGAPADATYAWEARGTTANTDLLVERTDGPTPSFEAPNNVEQTTRYEYMLTVSAESIHPATANVTVTVLNTGAIAVTCPGNPYEAYEGDPDLTLNCEATGGAGAQYIFSWTARSAASDVSLLSDPKALSPMFLVPPEVQETETHEYTLTVSAGDDSEPGDARVSVTVIDKPAILVACENPLPVYEGADDIKIDCEATGGPDGAVFASSWKAQGGRADIRLLSDANDLSPMFAVPDDVAQTTIYEYELTVSAPGAKDGVANVIVTVLNKGALAVMCAGNPYSAYEGSDDFALDCTATGAPEGSDYTYAWKGRGATTDTDRLSAANALSPLFDVPDAVDQNETYEYELTVSAENAEDGMAFVTVTVLNKGAIAVACAGNPYEAYEGADDFPLECSATGAPEGSTYEYAWEARAATTGTDRLSAADVLSPVFDVPDAVDQNETYEYRLTVLAENADGGAVDVTVTVLNKGALAIACPGNPYEAYEGAENFPLDCAATGAPEGSSYAYAWEARGATTDTERLLTGTDGPTPMFDVPSSVNADETYEYRLTVSAQNAEPAAADVTVTVLDQPLAETASLGIAVDVSLLDFGMQSADTQVTLDPLTDRITASLSGPYHAGRMTLVLADADTAAVSVEMLAPATLRLIGDDDAPPIALEPAWSYASSCEQRATTAIRGLHAAATLSESNDCRLLLFGGSLDLAGARSGLYEGTINVVLRSGAAEETHSVRAETFVMAADGAITIGPGGVRFETTHETPLILLEDQNMSVYPDLAFLTEETPSGAFTVSNPSLIPLEISVTARFGYAEATADGRETVVEDKAASRLGDLSEWVDMYPQTLVLESGEEGVVRYAMKAEALSTLTKAGYAAFFEITSLPRMYAFAERLPEEASEDKTARVTLRIPGAYVPGAEAARLGAELLSVSQGASPAATFLVETDARPFAGEVVAYGADGRELGRTRTLAYTRSRARMTLERTPEEGEAVVLRFVPRHSGPAPEPVTIRWSAAAEGRREIGAAQDRNESPTEAALAETSP